MREFSSGRNDAEAAQLRRRSENEAGGLKCGSTDSMCRYH